MKRDNYGSLNKKKHKGNGIIILIGVLALFITGILYARKLQKDSKYISEVPDNYNIEANERMNG